MAADEQFSVRIDKSQGLIEISGPDQNWISEQLEMLVPVLDASPSLPADEPPPADGENEDDKDAAKNRTRRSTKKSGGGTRTKPNPELQKLLTPDTKKSFAEYQKQRESHWSKVSNRLAIIATFLLDELEWEGVSGSDVYTVCTVMGWPVPGNPRSALTNAVQRDSFFRGESDGKFVLSHTGENFARHVSLEPKPTKKKAGSD